MALLGTNGGLIGAQRITTTGAGIGVWTTNEQAVLQRAGVWPITGDPYFSSVSLLLHMDGSNGSTSFVDSSSNNVTCTPTGATISTTQSKFGGASGYFNGSSTVSAASSSLFAFGTGDFTLEGWAYLNSGVPYSYPVLIQIDYSGGKTYIRYGDSGFGYMLQVSLQDTSLYNVYSCSVTQYTYAAQWVHLALTRSAGNCRLFVNGNLQNLNSGPAPSTFPMTSFSDTSNITSVTQVRVGNGGGAWNGYLDEVRVTKGIARYTTSFTPPVAAFTNY